MPASTIGHPISPPVLPRPAERYRRLFQENVCGAVFETVFPLLNPFRPHSGVRADLHVQRHLAVTRARSFCRT